MEKTNYISEITVTHITPDTKSHLLERISILKKNSWSVLLHDVRPGPTHKRIVTIMKRLLVVLIIALLGNQTTWAARAKVDVIARDPYVSALVVEAKSGKVLFDENSRTIVYPASVLKLMDLLVILEYVEQGKLQLDEMVQVTDDAAKMGGSQVYLDPKEQFTVEELLFALAVQSANDAAVALAIHVAGSVEEFVAMMNQKADELGMKDTTFHSVHGLPPASGQSPDVTTAFDLSLLGRELTRHQEIFKYTSMKQRDFRGGAFVMRNHNHLLRQVFGCDGFKTGYFKAAGFSIIATAIRDETRIIAIVMGSVDRKVRDAKAAELIAKGFSLVEKTDDPPAAKSPLKEAPVMAEPLPDTKKEEIPPPSPPSREVTHGPSKQTGAGFGMFFAGLATGLVLSGLFALYIKRKRSRRPPNYRRYR